MEGQDTPTKYDFWILMESAWRDFWKLANFLRPFVLESLWVLCGIILPLAAIIVEKWTEVCARVFFDPLPTDGHLILFALIPITNLFGELSRIKALSGVLSWVKSPAFKWINGMAIGIAGFYALWFLPVGLLCLILLTALVGVGPWVVFAALFGVMTRSSSPGILEFIGQIALFFGLSLGAVAFLLLPLSPLMSCIACYRTRKRLFTEEQIVSTNSIVEQAPETKTEALITSQTASVPFYKKRWLVIPVGIAAYMLFFNLAIYKFWLPYVLAHNVSFGAKQFWNDPLPVFGPPLLLLMLVFWPSPLSPFQWFANDASKTDGKVVKTVQVNNAKERLFLPIACALLALVLIEIPSTATRVAESMILDPDKSAQGLLILRAFGNEESMLRLCYEKSEATDILGSILTWNKPVPKEKARQIFYQATGKPFNSINIPASFRGKTRDFSAWEMGDEDDVFDSDAELAGETVGGVVRGVTLNNSEIISDIDIPARAATIRWDMEFNNTSKYQREARVQILLPPNAVVSDVLLWENGQPQPAAFGPRGLTRAAYKAVVAHKRDPLLVTTYGPDRVLAQCFPIPPKGNMHIRIGITAPLLLSSNNEAFLTLPIFLERNFQVDRHFVKVTANGKITNPSQVLKSAMKGEDDNHRITNAAFMGVISNANLSQGKGTIKVDYLAKSYPVWSKDVNTGHYIVQTISAAQAQRPNKLVVVVDGSAAVAKDADLIEKCLSEIPDGINITLLRAGDRVETIIENLSGSKDSKWKDALQNLRSQTYVGGQDDTRALIKATDLIGNDKQGAILWLHGPQPVKIENPDKLADKLNACSGITLYELQIENGPNRTVEALDGVRNITRLPVVISSEDTLNHLFSTWTNDVQDFQPSYSKVNTVPYKYANYESQIDLSPLWANQTICPLRWSSRDEDIEDAVQTAMLYRVVTPVSGAVVLENQADYDRYGLGGLKRNFKEYKLSKSAKDLDADAPRPSLASQAKGSTFESRKAELEQKITGAPDAKAVPEPDNLLLAFVALAFGLIFMVNRKMFSAKYEH